MSLNHLNLLILKYYTQTSEVCTRVKLRPLLSNVIIHLDRLQMCRLGLFNMFVFANGKFYPSWKIHLVQVQSILWRVLIWIGFYRFNCTDNIKSAYKDKNIILTFLWLTNSVIIIVMQIVGTPIKRASLMLQICYS